MNNSNYSQDINIILLATVLPQVTYQTFLSF